ncbi:cytochrome P450 [Nocardia ninae]|uniref:Cytochrome P450 n=1 Tax=Nocardia ninae NBRC 108245 TaxID=1210091 RepID=A0A511MS62_9NOCA|nr:cytochrome P450 [Nocardia ninae]GEM43433.1 cytochrome P450 [Nocardia ninae NBRC 108245]
MTISTAKPLDMLPHAPGRLPILGDLTSVDRRRPTQHELTLARRGLGPIFERKLLRTRVIIVSGARLATQCSDEDTWARCLAGPGEVLRQIVPEGLFTARSSNPLWAQARRILTPGFNQAAMRSYHEAMNSVADDLIPEWSAAQGHRVDVHGAMTAATLEVIGRAGFSRRLGLLGPGEVDGSNSRWFVDALAEVLTWASGQTNDLPVIGTIRTLLRTPRARAQIAAANQYVDAVIADRQNRTISGTDDLLGLMLSTPDPETGQLLPAQNVREQVLTFLVAGHETTAALLEASLHYIAADPNLQKELRTEVHDRGAFDYEAVTRMRKIRNLLNEVLRLWPPVPGLFRLARTDQTLAGYRIPAGQPVFVLALAAQRDPEVWGPEADRFDPDRFDAARLRDYPDRWFHPFGVGPRACIGRAFALHESTLLLARLLDAFTLTGAGELRMEERGSLRPEPFQLTALPRP